MTLVKSAQEIFAVQPKLGINQNSVTRPLAAGYKFTVSDLLAKQAPTAPARCLRLRLRNALT